MLFACYRVLVRQIKQLVLSFLPRHVWTNCEDFVLF